MGISPKLFKDSCKSLDVNDISIYDPDYNISACILYISKIYSSPMLLSKYNIDNINRFYLSLFGYDYGINNLIDMINTTNILSMVNDVNIFTNVLNKSGDKNIRSSAEFVIMVIDLYNEITNSKLTESMSNAKNNLKLSIKTLVDKYNKLYNENVILWNFEE
jgi:hypothetical protein